jgi:hypothetical protein
MKVINDQKIPIAIQAVQSADILFIQNKDLFRVPESLWIFGLIVFAGHKANWRENHALLKRIWRHAQNLVNYLSFSGKEAMHGRVGIGSQEGIADRGCGRQ